MEGISFDPVLLHNRQLNLQDRSWRRASKDRGMNIMSSLSKSYLCGGAFPTPPRENKFCRRTSLQCDTLTKSKPTPSKSIYRQPNSQRIRPIPSSLEYRRQQFGRYLFVSESFMPTKNPLVRRHSSAEIIRPTTNCFLDDDGEDDNISCPQSILKRGSSEDGTSVTAVNGNRKNSNHPQLRKQLSFQESVDVVYFDNQEATKLHMHERKEQEKLKDVTISQQRLTERTIHMKCPLHTDDNRSCDTNQKCECPPAPNHIFKNKQGEIVKDLTGKYSWKLFIPIGNEFLRNRTSVKALSGGHKLIVLTYKEMRGDEGQTYSHQFIEKLHLPHPIDAYGVRASMDKDGNLKINAPFLADKYKS